MSDLSYTVVLLNPRDRVIQAAERLGLSMVIVPAPGTPDPVGARGRVMRSPWTTDTGDLTRRLRDLDLSAPVTCFGFGEIGCWVAAVVNERLGWPGSGPGSLEIFRDKGRLRAAVADRAGAPVEHQTCTAEEVADAVRRIGFPCIVKPVDGTGSAGVRLLTAQTDLDAYLVDSTPAATYLVEEFLVGTEYSVEAMSSPQQGHRILALTEKMTTGAPHFVETGHTLPTRLDPAQEAVVAELVTATLEAAQYRYGVSHTEVMLTGGGPRLIESHGRPGGDRISDMLYLALGEDVFAQAMAAVFGLPLPSQPAWNRMAGIRYVTFDLNTRLPEIDTGAVARLPGVVEVSLSVAPGDLPPMVRRSRDRHGFVLATGDTRVELEDSLSRAVTALTRSAHRRISPSRRSGRPRPRRPA